VHVSQLEVGSQIAAANIGLTFRGTYYHLQASYTDGDIARFGPGAAHLHDLLRYAIEHGFKTYDFTIGDERYKLDWCDGAHKLYDHISVATWRGALVVAPVIAMQKIKRRIKQTPWLWNAFSKARALIGSLSSPGEK
jgi:CelD/BcsL family acetyltransferase involved in cellulose biosynthesis